MKRIFVTMLMFVMLLSQPVISSAEEYPNLSMGPDGEHYLFAPRPDGEYGFQWYEESWVQLEWSSCVVNKKGTCTSMTLFDRARGMKLTFDFQITKDKLPKYKLPGNKFFYNYQADWLQVESKAGDIIYTDVPVDDSNGELYNIKVKK